MDLRPLKRVKLSSERDGRIRDDSNPATIRAQRAAFLSSISRSISPPVTSRLGTSTPQPVGDAAIASQSGAAPSARSPLECCPATSKDDNKTAVTHSTTFEPKAASGVKRIASPFKLTAISGLPPSQNVDTVSLSDILGNPLIKEAWVFNYCFDVDWFMNFFDSDIRNQVKVRIVHGSWKSEDRNKQGIDDACRRWENVEASAAYLPDQFGTHHSKMFVLFTHDDFAQVVIHTANMLSQDWTNLTQAAWISPMLPLLKTNASTVVGSIGSGSRFKHDLLAYLVAYGSKTKSLREQLALFDFASVRGALIASVPSRMKDYPTTKDPKALWDQKLWGYPSLYRALSSILQKQQKDSSPHAVCQISSIATLPQKWLNQFFPVLCGVPSLGVEQQWDPSRISIIYPTPPNIGSSLNGYASGGSIHTKAQSDAHRTQIDNLRPSLCQWTRGPQENQRAGRHEAAPHIKTFVSFTTKPTKERPVQGVQWALLTSANLSQQAWGTLRESGRGKQKEKEIVVQSYEIGVLVWPELFAEEFDNGEGEKHREDENRRPTSKSNGMVTMVPVFGKDTPSASELSLQSETSSTTETVVGLRLPYDLPLTPYGKEDMPWSMQGTYEQPDRFGRSWT